MKKHHRAFTLIELLLGLSIFSMIALCVYSVFWGGMRLAQKAEDRSDVYREARRALELMSRELENMAFYDFTGSYPDKSALTGGDKEITFILDGEQGLKAVTYSLVAPGQGHVFKTVVGRTYSKNVSVTTESREESRVEYLVRGETAFPDFLSGRRDDAQTEVVSVRIKENGLRFFYKDFPEDDETPDGAWSPSWEQPYLPRDIRVELDFAALPGREGGLTLTRDIMIPTGASFVF